MLEAVLETDSTFWEHPSDLLKEGGSSASSCDYFFRKVDTCTSRGDKSGLWLSGKRNCFPAV